MRALGAERPEIPLHVMIAQAIVGPALLAADEVLELHWITDKEDRRIVADHVEIAVLGIKLHREPARITPCVGAAALARHGGKAHPRFHFCTGLEELRLGVFADVGRYLEIAECAAPLCVRLTFRDPLAIEVRHLLDQIVIVEHDRTVTPDGKRMLVALDWNAGVGCRAGGGFLVSHCQRLRGAFWEGSSTTARGTTGSRQRITGSPPIVVG
jgi:hypothetical protein